MYEDVAILSTSLGRYEHAMYVLHLGSNVNLDRPISTRVLKKVVSKSLEYYNRTRNAFESKLESQDHVMEFNADTVKSDSAFFFKDTEDGDNGGSASESFRLYIFDYLATQFI